MPFCSKCGNEIAENVNFCQKCGNATQGGQIPNQGSNAITEGEAKLSDKWAWTLACVPIFGIILEHIIKASGFYSDWTGIFVFVILNVIFLTLDLSELKDKKYNPDGWLWLGLLLVPVYLFVRASKTNRQFAYAITWCVLFVLSLFSNPITVTPIFDPGVMKHLLESNY